MENTENKDNDYVNRSMYNIDFYLTHHKYNQAFGLLIYVLENLEEKGDTHGRTTLLKYYKQRIIDGVLN